MKLTRTNTKEVSLDELSSVGGGFEFTNTPDSRIGWLEGHNIRCAVCKTEEPGMIDVTVAENGTDAKCFCRKCGGTYKYRIIDDHIWIVR